MLNGKIAAVTGGARGIGAAICRKLASLGADIAIIDLRETEQAVALRDELVQTYGVKAAFFACNVGDAEQCRETVKAVTETLGGLTILVNNAGITRDALMLAMKEADFDAVINTNLKGVFNMTQACYRTFMKARYGKIVNLASVSGMLGTAGQANYAASKAGVMALTKVTARELASRGVTCNAVAPGFIATEMTAAISDEATAQYLKSIPLERAGKPEDVANLVAFLSSPESDYLTGEVIRIDGGLAIS